MKKILNFIKKILNFLNLNLIINLKKNLVGLPVINRGIGFILSFSNKAYISHNLRPKDAKNFSYCSTDEVEEDKIGILIQGPIPNNEDLYFLEQTINIYEKIFPNQKVVLSTWDNCNTGSLQRKKNLEIIKSKSPDKPGLSNINYQIKSTSEGIRLFKENKIKNVLKTRTDARIMKPNTSSFLLNLQKTFPAEDNNFGRIFTGSIATCKYRIYGVSDILLFGKIEDLDLYFKNEDEESILPKYNFERIMNETGVIAEVLLCARYLKNKNVKLEWSLNHWWKCLKDYFGIIDAHSLDFFMHKYNWDLEQRYIKNYSKKSDRCFEFSEWLSLYNGTNLNLDKLDYKEKSLIENGKVKKIQIL